MSRKSIVAGAVLLSVLLLCLFAWNSRPYDDSVTLGALSSAMETSAVIAAQTPNQSYYEFAGSSSLPPLLRFDDWQISGSNPEEKPALKLRFGEAWILDFYETGLVRAHNGYAKLGAKADCYYRVPEQLLPPLFYYIEQNALPAQLVYGSATDSLFHD